MCPGINKKHDVASDLLTDPDNGFEMLVADHFRELLGSEATLERLPKPFFGNGHTRFDPATSSPVGHGCDEKNEDSAGGIQPLPGDSRNYPDVIRFCMVSERLVQQRDRMKNRRQAASSKDHAVRSGEWGNRMRPTL
jgi:hypothetical protein